MGTRTWHRTAVLVGGALLLVTAACGGGSSSKATTTTAASATSSTTATTTTSTSAHPSTTAAAAELTVTPDSVGALRIGMTYAQATATGLIEPFGTGCELATPVPVAAHLKPPVNGSVGGTDGHITDFNVSAGYVTSPGGIRNGATLAAVQAAFTPKYTVQVDKTQEQTFELWFANVLDAGKQVFTFSIDPKTQRVTELSVPQTMFCE